MPKPRRAGEIVSPSTDRSAPGRLPAAAAVVAAVAKAFSGTWERGEPPRDAWITVAGARVAVDLGAMGTAQGGTPLRLRYDRVALRLVNGLRDALHDDVPDGETVVLTVTAPILLPGRTAAALEERIRARLADGSARAKLHDIVHGNKVRIRLANGGPRGMPRLVGFVHNPHSHADILLEAARSLIEGLGAAARRRKAPDGTPTDT